MCFTIVCVSLQCVFHYSVMRASPVTYVPQIVLSCVLHRSVMNYALALTPISWQLFLAATVVSSIPYTMLYVYLGSVSTDVWQVMWWSRKLVYGPLLLDAEQSLCFRPAQTHTLG